MTPPLPRMNFGEPYRVLFPIGIVLGLYGVLLWPAFVYGLSSFYPAVPHARIMIQGFLFSFSSGFLGTAMPHMLETRPWHPATTLLIAAGILLLNVLHAFGHHPAGDTVFLLTLSGVLFSLLRHFPERKDLPPPGFPLVGLGMLCGALGTLLLILQPRIGGGAFIHHFSRALLYQGFMLLPVMGIGVYLLPRMFGLPNPNLFPPMTSPSPAWRNRALTLLAAGLLILLSFVLEGLQNFRTAYLLRAAVFSLCFFRDVPPGNLYKGQGSLSIALPGAILSIPIGYLCMAIWLPLRIDMLHIVMITGFSWLTLLVATRVILGHGDRIHLVKSRFRTLRAGSGLALLAVATRVTAPSLRHGPFSHYAYAAITLAVVMLIWSARFFPLLKSSPGNDHVQTN